MTSTPTVGISQMTTITMIAMRTNQPPFFTPTGCSFFFAAFFGAGSTPATSVGAGGAARLI